MVEKEVRHELLTLPWYSVFDNLAYGVNGNEVTLSGQVVNPTVKTDAENAAIGGVAKAFDAPTVGAVGSFEHAGERGVREAVAGRGRVDVRGDLSGDSGEDVVGAANENGDTVNDAVDFYAALAGKTRIA